MTAYDPFQPGRFAVGVRTEQLVDAVRDRVFPCEIWYPCDESTVVEALPLILFSHSAGGDRRQSSFLCTHLSSHGYVVAALDHYERVCRELKRHAEETPQQTAQRWESMISSRVPDIRVLMDHLLHPTWNWGIPIDPARIGIVGHSFGGWTALAAPDVIHEIRAVVALAPGGASRRRPGILPVELAFLWGREVPTLLLVAEDDVSLPLQGMFEIYERIPSTKQMAILHRADHVHFMDNVEELHEMVRAMPATGDLAAIVKDMRPIGELCSERDAHLFTQGLTLCHMDAMLRGQEDAKRYWFGRFDNELKARGIDALLHR